MKFTDALLKKLAEFSYRYSNLPEKYIQQSTERIRWQTPRGKPNYRAVTVKNKKFLYTTERPWTTGSRVFNANCRYFPHVEPIKNWSFFRGDRVEVLTGPDKGKQGVVSQIIQERNWIIVRGLNTKLMKMPHKTDPWHTYTLMEQPLLVTCQVQLVDPSDLKATPIDWQYTEEGEHVRVSMRSGKIIPIPASHDETVDYQHPSTYTERSKDTLQADVEEITFEPELKTFEMDIMDKMGIKEDRVPGKCFWY